MQKRTVLVSLLAGCAILAMGAFVSAQAQTKVDPTGTWTWTTPGGRGPNASTNATPRMMTNTLVLKMDGDKLTGTLSAPGRQGAVTEIKVDDLKVTGDDISFSVSREYNGNTRTTKYSGKLTADTIKGKIESEGRNGPVSRDFEAKKK
jgi:hypothetical protein